MRMDMGVYLENFSCVHNNKDLFHKKMLKKITERKKEKKEILFILTTYRFRLERVFYCLQHISF